MSTLKRKQASSQVDWIDAISNIDSIVTKRELDNLIDKTVCECKLELKGYAKVHYAWSGGKDSIVLDGIMRLVGIEDCMMALTELEYPNFLGWVTDFMPNGLSLVPTWHDLTWLSQNQDMLFPQDSKIAARWFKSVQHQAQAAYYVKNKLDLIVLGRRRADGNYVGGEKGIYQSKGIVRYSPLQHWSHEHILAFIHYNKLPLPPIYGWHKGFVCGTHPWAARQYTGSIKNGWAEVYDIDSTIVTHAATVIKSARDFLRQYS